MPAGQLHYFPYFSQIDSSDKDANRVKSMCILFYSLSHLTLKGSLVMSSLFTVKVSVPVTEFYPELPSIPQGRPDRCDGSSTAWLPAAPGTQAWAAVSCGHSAAGGSTTAGGSSTAAAAGFLLDGHVQWNERFVVIVTTTFCATVNHHSFVI